jgi:hypothetical protein
VLEGDARGEIALDLARRAAHLLVEQRLRIVQTEHRGEVDEVARMRPSTAVSCTSRSR